MSLSSHPEIEPLRTKALMANIQMKFVRFVEILHGINTEILPISHQDTG